jgi:hypothetical protein
MTEYSISSSYQHTEACPSIQSNPSPTKPQKPKPSPQKLDKWKTLKNLTHESSDPNPQKILLQKNLQKFEQARFIMFDTDCDSLQQIGYSYHKIPDGYPLTVCTGRANDKISQQNLNDQC